MANRYVNSNGELANMENNPIMLRASDVAAMKAGTVPDALKGAAIGTMAFSAGYADMWQLDTDGVTWVPLGGGE